MVVHSPVAARILVVHNLAGDILVEGIPAEDNLDTLHLAAGNPAVAHTPAEDILDTLHLGADNPAAAHFPVADKSARDSPVVVDSPVVAAHNPAVLCSVADIAAFRLAADSFAAARNLAADNFVAAADFSFGFVRAAAVLLPVVRNTCKTALRPATAGNNSYST